MDNGLYEQNMYLKSHDKSTISNSAFVATETNNFSDYLTTQITCADALVHFTAIFDQVQHVFAQKYKI